MIPQPQSVVLVHGPGSVQHLASLAGDACRCRRSSHIRHKTVRRCLWEAYTKGSAMMGNLVCQACQHHPKWCNCSFPLSRDGVPLAVRHILYPVLAPTFCSQRKVVFQGIISTSSSSMLVSESECKKDGAFELHCSISSLGAAETSPNGSFTRGASSSRVFPIG